MVQQSDIDGAASGLVGTLTRGAQADLGGQVGRGERVIDGSVACRTQTNASQRAGDVVKNVSVQVAVTCGEEVYDDAAVRQVAGGLLSAAAGGDPNLGEIGRASCRERV